MSIAARRLFFNLNCKVVKIALKNKFKIKGSSTMKANPPLKNLTKTEPKEIKIKIYKTLQTGPKSHEGGAQVGLISLLYQV